MTKLNNMCSSSTNIDASCVKIESIDIKDEPIDQETKEEEMLVDIKFVEVISDSHDDQRYQAASKIDQSEVSKTDPLRIKWYKCKLCAYASKSKTILKKHAALNHKEDSYSLPPKANYNLMPKVISGLPEFECKLCKYTSKYKKNWKQHMISRHMSYLKDELFICDHCSFYSTRQNIFNKHMLTHGSLEIQRYECNTCGAIFNGKYKLQQHMSTHRSTQIRMEVSGQLLQLTNENNKRTSRMLKWYVCELCNYKTIYQSNWKQHRSSHMNESDKEVFRCGKCSFEFTNLDTFNQHKLIHVDEQSLLYKQWYECEVCHYRTMYRDNFKEHMADHKKKD